MSEIFTLSTVDFAIFGITLASLAAIGIYFRQFSPGGRQETNKEYFLAGKDMSILPVSFSLMATFLSSTTMMGIPAEMYLFGTNMAFMNIGFIIGPIISSYLFLPIYFNNGFLTVFEYLERRFGKTTRRLLSLLYIFQDILFSGISLYAPALALNAVSNLSIWFFIVPFAVICVFYSALGGMKAVIWTDVFHALLMYTCVICVIVKGCGDLGGIESVFHTAYDGGRIVLPTFRMDFSVRYTMWNILLQGAIISINSYAGSQADVQRQLTLKNLKKSRMATFLSIPMTVAFHLLCCMCGIILYVHFKSCDPLTFESPTVRSADQLLPYYIATALKDYPGLPGLCFAGIFSASLSSISSCINSIVAVTFEDLLHPIFPKLYGSVCAKRIANIFYGVLSVIVIYLISTMGNLVKSTVLIIGMMSGPILGVFLLGSLSRITNEPGVNLGVLFGFLTSACLTFLPNDKHYPTLPHGGNCSVEFDGTANFTWPINKVILQSNTTQILTDVLPVEDYQEKFSLSFMWISSLSLIVCIVFGYMASWIIFRFQGRSESTPNELLSPVRLWIWNDVESKESLRKNSLLNLESLER